MSVGDLARVEGAHPRVSGENGFLEGKPKLKAGSSPRERGKLDIDAVEPRNVRLIPA